MNSALIQAAQAVAGQFGLSKARLTAGRVGAALRTISGRIHTGICLDLACGIGNCAEHSAIVEMLNHRETEVESVVAISDSRIIPPCGRCRELLMQIDVKNQNTKLIVNEGEFVVLRELLPYYWIDSNREGNPEGATPMRRSISYRRVAPAASEAINGFCETTFS